jgi:hypothetical protein
MIASPYAYAVKLPILADTLFAWDGLGYAATDVLEPWKGYFYYSAQPASLVFDGRPFNPTGAEHLTRSLAKPLFKTLSDWQVRVLAMGGHSSDPSNLLGVSTLGKRGDIHEPPASPLSGVSLYFVEDESRGGPLARSLRGSFGETEQWVMAVNPGNDKGKVTLRFEGIADLPANLFAYLGDNNDYTDLRATPEISVTLSKEHFYTVVVTRDAHFLDKVGKKFDLAQNAPNPFNPATRILFAIPSLFGADGKPLAEKPLVSLKIFDIRGKLVRTLTESRHEAGKRYAVEWNGKSNTGLMAASGIYVYRIEVEGKFTSVRKMVMIK